MVRLLTHNMLACHAKQCKHTSLAFPLLFKDVTVQITEMEMHADFLRAFLPRLDWKALVGAASQVRC